MDVSGFAIMARLRRIPMPATSKKASVKSIKVEMVWRDGQWTVRFGYLNPGRGRPQAVTSLFHVIGEKLPFESINAVNGILKAEGITRSGVYVPQESQGD